VWGVREGCLLYETGGNQNWTIFATELGDGLSCGIVVKLIVEGIVGLNIDLCFTWGIKKVNKRSRCIFILR